ncbi:hypothetical protein UA08_06723 [Talaromyces atroroseus]|uniref:GRF-type domain-containing protein n=1 Tax=Talaromyces atroroseus TaxID=1441469 RepID=A0A225AAT4_TALAT|nr:hypothetical protein UA08_06723 [Talaromyces atroroseus]OKL58111.1 hypothetical protein UA08_06723 [Talaromyces atroroseus]
MSSWRGRFIEGVWHCDCDPRLPAEHFQTKKAGVNRGRWFYTCQKPQSEGCKFFLWEDDAQVREKQTVLANSRSEHHTPMRRPPKNNNTSTQVGGLLTPGTGARRTQASAHQNEEITLTPTKVRRIEQSTLDEDDNWDDNWDDEVEKIMTRSTGPMRQPVFSPSTPSQTPRTATKSTTSPGKRKFEDFSNDDHPPPSSETEPGSSQSSFMTMSAAPFSSVEVSATPTPRRYKDVLSAHGMSSTSLSDLSAKVFAIFDRHNVVVPTVARDEVSMFLDQQHLRAQGILRGREMSWMALKKKDGEIKSLKERIESLESEREMDRIVIDCLKKSK